MTLLIFLFWVVLNGRVTWEIGLLGAAVTALGLVFLCRECSWSLKKEAKLYRVAPRIILYCLLVIWEIVKANLKTAIVVWRGQTDPVVRTVETSLKTRFGKMALANSITLTPGTITLSCTENRLTVHCLTQEMACGLENIVFERSLLKIEEALHG